MIASSTSTPIATANPPSVIALSVSPKRASARASPRRATTGSPRTRSAPRARRARTRTARRARARPPRQGRRGGSPSARSMKVAGRCIAGYTVMPSAVSRGTRSASAVSSARVTSIVFAPNWLEIVISTPSRPCTRRRPRAAPLRSRLLARSPIVSGTPLRTVTTAAANTAGSGAGTGDSTSTRCARDVDEARAAQRERRARGLGKVAEREPVGLELREVRRDLQLAHAPPYTLTRATPCTASSCGLRLQSARSRSANASSRSETRPIFSTSIVLDVSGESFGAPVPSGSAAATRARRSATSWCARCGSAPSPKSSDTTESPGIDSERSAASAGRAVHGGLDRPRHERLDLIRREARRLGLDRDLRRHELGEHVERRVARLPDAEHEKRGGEDRDDHRGADAPRDEPTHRLQSSASAPPPISRASRRPAPATTTCIARGVKPSAWK